MVVGTRLGDSEEVLALARPVEVGHELRARDLREISIVADNGLPALAARSRSSVEGRPVAYSLPAGALLTETVVGEARVPPRGAGIVAIGLKAGQFPPGLQSGNRVTVVMTAREPGSTASTAASSTSWSATVIAVGKPPNEQTTVASLQMDAAAARQLATAREGEVTVVIVNGGRT
ncbi:SAF domain-containing protein [Streptomyces sp. NPDC102364]|uniref:SAF domain-containing protein n=1 Tax=Streptomyces sp. NPDC102364 TaxID=3366161 RepID=UPI00380FDF67